MFQVYNFTDEEITIKAGERIGQGVFLPYAITDGDAAISDVRTGGFGST